MKSLKKYLNPKSKWHPGIKISLPDDPHDVESYLLNIGFTELEYKEGEDWEPKQGRIIDAAQEDNVFITDPGNWIYFCKKGEITKENPIFCISSLRFTNIHFSAEWGRSYKVTYRYMKTYQDFKEQVEKCFNS